MIRIEFYGIPRRRSGVAETLVETGDGATLADVLRVLGRRFPDVAEECLDADGLRRGFAANLNGERFVSDPLTAIRDGDVLLLMSADAGG